ncbi:MAG: 2-phosphosulfolactate phosphatase [Actinomycetes bacterium]
MGRTATPVSRTHRDCDNLGEMEIRLEWGPNGAQSLARWGDVLVIVDVFSFSTSVSVAASRNVQVWPSPMNEGAASLAREIGAQLARGRRTGTGPTLSPVSLSTLEEGSRLVLPSPNGSAISHAAVKEGVHAVAGCLRNAAAVAEYLSQFDRVGLVPAGERWADNGLRPAYEDWVGAGAIADAVQSRDGEVALSPEAEAAALAFWARRPLEQSSTGHGLVEKGFADDVRLAQEVDGDAAVPLLRGGRYVTWQPGETSAA